MKWFLAAITVLLGIILLYLRRIFIRRDKKIEHDVQIYKHFSNIISDEDFEKILSDTEVTYFPNDLMHQAEVFYWECKKVHNNYVNRDLQTKINALANALIELAKLYAHSSFAEEVGGNRVKLVSIKDRGTLEEHNQLREQNLKLWRDLKTAYEDYRKCVKKKLLL